jgi:H+/Cl- antiporter ClcA
MSSWPFLKGTSNWVKLFTFGDGVPLYPPQWLMAPFIAVIGFIAVFASARNTPIASTLMGIEFLGPGFAGSLVIT